MNEENLENIEEVGTQPFKEEFRTKKAQKLIDKEVADQLRKESLARKENQAKEAMLKATPSNTEHSPEFPITPDAPLELRIAHYKQYGEKIGEIPLDDPRTALTVEEIASLRVNYPKRYRDLVVRGIIKII